MKGYVELPVSQIFLADWNYKKDDAKLMKKLTASIKELGFIESIIVREIGTEKYECINGNHRLKSLKKTKTENVFCYNLGPIGLDEAKRISIETNETNFESNINKMSDLMGKIGGKFSMEEVALIMPFSDKQLKDLVAIPDVEIGGEEFLDGSESFDLDEGEIEKKGSVESFSSDEKIEFMANKDVVEEFNSLINAVKRKIKPKSPPSMVDDAEAIEFILKLFDC